MIIPKGQVNSYTILSEVLASNQAAMDPLRPYVVYTPAIEHLKEPLPVLYILAAWTNAGRNLLTWMPFKKSIPEMLDSLIATQRMQPCLVVCPDLYTDFGGSQYIDSEYLGNHARFVIDELIPKIEATHYIKQGHEHRGVIGISSGGFGALRFALDWDHAFSAVGCHSGDMGFDWVYRGDLPQLTRTLAKYQGNPMAYREACRKQTKYSGSDIHAHMLLGMAASYSPNLSSPYGFDLPMDQYSGVLLDDIWQRWLQHDPLTRVSQQQCLKRLKSLRALFLDVGIRDQYNLLYGARQMHLYLNQAEIVHQYVEFDDDHSSLTYRYLESLPFVVNALA